MVFIIIFITNSNSSYLHKLGDNMTIKLLKIECTGMSYKSSTNGQGESITKVVLEDVPVFELMHELIKEVGIKEILDHITAHDIAIYMKDCNENLDGVTVTVKGVKEVFEGDELTSPVHQAEAFIHQLATDEEMF